MSDNDDTEASSELETSEEEEQEEEDDDEEAEEVEVPKLELPSRATRGKRLNKLLEEEDSADEEFWNQDFFQEDKGDDEYEEESSEESTADTDFEEAESTSDEEGEEVEERSKRKTLKPPGAKKQPARKPQAPPPVATRSPPTPGPAGATTPGSPMSPTTRAAVRQATLDSMAEAQQFQAPTLRKSTRARVEEAEKERQLAEQKKPRKAQQKAEYRPLTQEELLAEAAQTELENTASVRALIAAEEEIKARAAARKAKYSGPLLRYHSFKSGDESVMLFEIANMLPPKEMQPQRAPAPPPKPVCVVTGQPAKYRDPETGMPYADVEAFKELRRRCADGKLLHHKRTKRRRFGTGGWAHVATALREDLPPASAWQGTPQSLPHPTNQSSVPTSSPVLQPAAVMAPAQPLPGSPAAGVLSPGMSQALPLPSMGLPSPLPASGSSKHAAAQPPLPSAVSLQGSAHSVSGAGLSGPHAMAASTPGMGLRQSPPAVLPSVTGAFSAVAPGKGLVSAGGAEPAVHHSGGPVDSGATPMDIEPAGGWQGTHVMPQPSLASAAVVADMSQRLPDAQNKHPP